MKRLSERQDKVVSFFLAGKTADEISGFIGVSRGRVYQIFSQGALRLRRERKTKDCRESSGPIDSVKIEKLLDTPVEQLPFSVRTMNCLRQLSGGGEVLLRDVVSRYEVDLMSLHGFGKKSLREVQEFLWINRVWHKDNVLQPECEQLWWK